MTTATAQIDLAQAQAIADKFSGIRTFQRDERGLIGRDTELHTVQTAIVARAHVLLFGVPGVAKSMTVDGVLRHLPELSQFKTQAYKASPPEQFLGPISIKGMERDEFVRIVLNKLADVEIGFIDEIARAPRAVLPAFQGAMVEREFDAGNGTMPIPLISLIGTCNHIPDDPELEAFFDRFALKLIVRPPASQEQFAEILSGALHRIEHGEPDVPDELIISAAELRALQGFANSVRVPDNVLGRLGELWSNLMGVGVMPSIRRYVDLTHAMQAVAALDGRGEVLLDDLQIAQHSLWSHPDEAKAVYAEVVKMASEWVQEKAKLIEDFSETLDRLGQVQALIASGAENTALAEIGESEKTLTDHGIKLVADQRKLRELIERHVKGAQGRDTSELDAIVAQIDATKQWIQDRLVAGLEL